MATSTISMGLSVGELERLLQKRRRELKTLTRKRTLVEKKLQALDARIRSISGGGFARGGGRIKNEVNLIGAIEAVLQDAGEPLQVGQILERVLKSGYRSTSANFRGIVNQSLIKDKRFRNTGRGVYGLKR